MYSRIWCKALTISLLCAAGALATTTTPADAAVSPTGVTNLLHSAVPGNEVPVSATAPVGETVISEDFSRSAANFQVILGGTWSITNGQHVLSNPAKEVISQVGNGNIALHNSPVQGDFLLSMQGSSTPTTAEKNDFSIIFSYKSPGNYYFVSFNESNDSSTSGIFKMVNGVQTELKNINHPITAGKLYNVKVERAGAAIKVWRNGAWMGNANDSTFNTGLLGFGTRNDGGKFDNLVVSTNVTDTVPPSVSITAPGEGATVSGTVDISVAARDDVAVTRVEFLVDGGVATSRTASPYVYGWNTAAVPNGEYSLMAKAYDAAGNVGLSAPISVTVNNNTAPLPTTPPPSSTSGSVALVMFAPWLSMDEFRSMFDGNLNGNDQIRYRVTDYPNNYDQADVDELKAVRATVPGLKLGISIAYADKIVQHASTLKSLGFDFIEYNLEADFDGPNSDGDAAANVARIKSAADATHAQGLLFRLTPGKPNSTSFMRTGLLDDVARLVDFYHIQAQSAQDSGATAYSDFTRSVAEGVRTANQGALITSQISPSQGAESGKTVQQTMRDVVTAAMAQPPPGNTQGAGMWIGGDDVADAEAFFAWFNQTHP